MKKRKIRNKTERKIKRVITTYFDENYKEMGEICLKTIKKYANKYNFDVKLYNQIQSERPPSWNKIILILKLFNEGYDEVLFIGSDASFIRFNENILNDIDKQKGADFFITLTNFGPNKIQVPNADVLFIRNTLWSKKLLKKIWDKKEYISNPIWENAAINDILFNLNEKTCPSKDKTLFNKLSCLRIVQGIPKVYRYRAISLFNQIRADFLKGSPLTTLPTSKKVGLLDEKWNYIPYGSCSNIKYPIIKHYAGFPDKDLRLKYMKRDLRKSIRNN